MKHILILAINKYIMHYEICAVKVFRIFQGHGCVQILFRNF